MKILPAFPDADITSGTTLVDTADLPWPGTSFGITPCAGADHVEASFALLAQALNVERSAIRSLHQVHGSAVRTFAESSQLCEGDALISDRPGEVIGVKIADCCAILIHDPVHRVVAAVHSGWRGTAQHVLTATMERLSQEWGSRAEDCSLYLSACASGAVYEVGRDVYDQLSPFCTPLDHSNDKWLFDNHAALLHEAEGLGVRRQSIIVEEACTITDARFHSYRRDRERSGRCFAFLGL